LILDNRSVAPTPFDRFEFAIRLGTPILPDTNKLDGSIANLDIATIIEAGHNVAERKTTNEPFRASRPATDVQQASTHKVNQTDNIKCKCSR